MEESISVASNSCMEPGEKARRCPTLNIDQILTISGSITYTYGIIWRKKKTWTKITIYLFPISLRFLEPSLIHVFFFHNEVILEPTVISSSPKSTDQPAVRWGFPRISAVAAMEWTLESAMTVMGPTVSWCTQWANMTTTLGVETAGLKGKDGPQICRGLPVRGRCNMFEINGYRSD